MSVSKGFSAHERLISDAADQLRRIGSEMKGAAEHTPGPWTLEAGRSIVTQSGTFHLSYGSDKHGNPSFRSFVELDRNAHLIAAAPDMLAALEDAIAMLQVYTDPRGRVNPATRGQAASTIRDAQAAIAKARGQE